MLTGTALRGLAQDLIGPEARGSNRKRRKNRKKQSAPGQDEATQQQIFARCVSQVPACEAELRRLCDQGPNCIALALPCCQSLTTCAFGDFFTCADEALSAL